MLEGVYRRCSDPRSRWVCSLVGVSVCLQLLICRDPLGGDYQVRQAAIQTGRPGTPYLNLLEPPSLIETFLQHPPESFLPVNLCRPERFVPGFLTPFDLLTTLDGSVKRIPYSILFSRPFLKLRTLFAGTTVSEYLVYPVSLDPGELVSYALEQLEKLKAHCLILKDIPLNSPLLTADENHAATQLLSHCRKAGFQILSGQSLAYVPIDFTSIEEYLQRLSYSRRKSLRRKLRSRCRVEVEEIPTGDRFFSEESIVRQLFHLYLNVYRQSKIHFDRLTFPFFCSLFQERSHRGIVFIYRREKTIIGYNICFIHNGNLVDKYVGFVYPDARAENLYFLSWFYNLEYAIKHQLKYYIAGWTDPEVKAFLGARFTFTHHAVYFKNPLLRSVSKKLKRFFESDQRWYDASRRASLDREHPV